MSYHRFVLILSTLLVLGGTPVSSEPLCPVPGTVNPEEAPELKLEEQELTIQKGLESIAWLEKDARNVIRRHKSTEDLLGNTEGFGIPFPNTVMIAKGVLLRQHALLEQERLEIVVLKRKAGKGAAEDIERQKRQFTMAQKEFCKFLRAAEYVD